MVRRVLTATLLLALGLGCGQSNPQPSPANDPKPEAPKTAQTTAAGDPAPETQPDNPPPDEPSEPEARSNEPEARPLYYEREITQADLEGRTLRELSLMRNTIFARAGNQFRKDWLREYFTAQPWYQPSDKLDKSKISELDWKNSSIIATYEAEISKEDLLKRKEEVLARVNAGKATPEDEIELRLLSSRIGTWLGAEDTPEENRSPLEDPSLLDKLLTKEQLENLSKRDLRILRNTVYARRGRPFKSALLQNYFFSTDWYQEDPNYSDAKLTDIDRRNIKLIRSVEDSLGGPLTDYEHMVEEDWFVVA